VKSKQKSKLKFLKNKRIELGDNPKLITSSNLSYLDEWMGGVGLIHPIHPSIAYN
jgi:hypothetical protein